MQTSRDVDNEILSAIRQNANENREITFNKLAQKVNIARDTLDKHLKRLVEIGKVGKRIDTDSKLKWQPVYYKALDTTLGQKFLDDIMKGLKELEPTKRLMQDLPRDEVQFLLSAYTHKIAFYMHLFSVHLMFEPYTIKAAPDMQKLELQAIISTLMEKAQNAVELLSRVDSTAVKPIYELLEKRAWRLPSNVMTLQEYRDSKKPKPPEPEPTLKDKLEDLRVAKIIAEGTIRMMKLAAKGAPKDKAAQADLKDAIRGLNELEREIAKLKKQKKKD